MHHREDPPGRQVLLLLQQLPLPSPTLLPHCVCCCECRTQGSWR
jgi:hypothetical protein